MTNLTQAYEGYQIINQVNSRFKKELNLSVVQIMILKEVSQVDGKIKKNELDKRLGISRSVANKPIKELRREKLIIKELDIENEMISLLSMSDEMKTKAKEILDKANKIFDDYLEELKNPKKEDDNKDAESKDENKDDNKEKNKPNEVDNKPNNNPNQQNINGNKDKNKPNDVFGKK